jgi:hypothetical protein
MKPFWKSKKFWGIMVSVLLRLFGRKLGLDPAAVDLSALTLGAGVVVEGVIDAADAIGRGLKK